MQSKRLRFLLIASLTAIVLTLPILGCSRNETDETTTSGGSSAQVIDVSLGVAGSISINGNATSLEGFGIGVDGVVDPEWSPVIIRISADDRCPVAQLSAVQDQLRSRGLANVIYKDGSGQELSLVLPAADSMAPAMPGEHLAHLAVSASGTATLDGTTIEAEAIQTAILDRLARDEHLIVAIDLDPAASYGDFFSCVRGGQEGRGPPDPAERAYGVGTPHSAGSRSVRATVGS